MGTSNNRSAYELLRRAMEEQSAQREGAEFGQIPNTPGPYSSNYCVAQGGLLGRLSALPADTGQQVDGNSGPMAPEPGENFRQLSRVSVVQPRSTIAPSIVPDIISEGAQFAAPSSDRQFGSGSEFASGPNIYSNASWVPTLSASKPGTSADIPFLTRPRTSDQEYVMSGLTHSQCTDRCLHLLPSPSGDLQSSEYRQCVGKCMGRLR
jgi:hypothetical protein